MPFRFRCLPRRHGRRRWSADPAPGRSTDPPGSSGETHRRTPPGPPRRPRGSGFRSPRSARRDRQGPPASRARLPSSRARSNTSTAAAHRPPSGNPREAIARAPCTAGSASSARTGRRPSRGAWSTLWPFLAASFAELLEPFCEEAPGPPEFFEMFLSLSVERVHLARRPLLGGDLFHVDEAALLDPDKQRVDRPFGDVREALLPQPGRDLVAVSRPAEQD